MRQPCGRSKMTLLKVFMIFMYFFHLSSYLYSVDNILNIAKTIYTPL